MSAAFVGRAAFFTAAVVLVVLWPPPNAVALADSCRRRTMTRSATASRSCARR
jgi:hypothetical protein